MGLLRSPRLGLLRLGVVSLVTVVATLLAVLAALAPASAAASAAASAGTAAGPVTSTVTASDTVGAHRAARGVDFPQLPRRCDGDHDGFPVVPCRVTHYRGRPTMILWGDSHALMYLPAVRTVARRQHVNLEVMFGGSCPPGVTHLAGARTYCETHNEQALAHVRDLKRRHVDFRVIVGGFWSAYRKADAAARTGRGATYSDYILRMARLAQVGSRPLFAQLASMGVRTDVIAQAATVPPDVRACSAGQEPYQCTIPRKQALQGAGVNRRWLARATSPLRRSPRVIDPSPVYCGPSTCFPRVRGANTFYDDVHLGRHLTATMVGYFAPSFRHWR